MNAFDPITLERFVDDINATGYPLQIAIAEAIAEAVREAQTNTTLSPPWTVVTSEHHWYNERNQEEGYIDVVLQRGRNYLVIECKKRQGSWTFVVDKKDLSRRQASCFQSRINGVFEGKQDIALNPNSVRSTYCYMQGTDKSKPLLESIAADVVSSCEALAIEESQLHFHGDLKRFFGVIVTTATLVACAIERPDLIVLETGAAPKEALTFVEVPWVRFRKQVSSGPHSYHTAGHHTRSLSSEKEHTIFVVNAAHLRRFLKEFEVDANF